MAGSGFAELLVTYVIVNWSLILEILLGDSSYVSHREEMSCLPRLLF